MTTELTILLFAVGLGFIQLVMAAVASALQRGAKWNLSSRDQAVPALTGKAARLDRAFANFKETFPFFLAAIVLVSLTSKSGAYSEYGAMGYLIARAIYVPLYVFNVIVVRTLAWAVSVLGIAAVLLQLFL